MESLWSKVCIYIYICYVDCLGHTVTGMSFRGLARRRLEDNPNTTAMLTLEVVGTKEAGKAILFVYLERMDSELINVI